MEPLTRAQEDAVSCLEQQPSEEKLWDCVLAFQDYPFFTASGLPFHYQVKRGKKGVYTKELLIDRREGSKSLTWGSIRLAYDRALECRGESISRPKALGDIRGVSYIYPLLWRFGLIKVPNDQSIHMSGDGFAEQFSLFDL